MIGGSDTIIPAVGDAADLEAVSRIVARFWHEARFENAATGDKYPRLDDIPFADVQELLAYVDAGAEAAWDEESPDAQENSMLYLIARPDEITVVVDNPRTAGMEPMLDAMRDVLSTHRKGQHEVQRRVSPRL